MISAGSPGAHRGMRKFRVATAHKVARKNPNFRAKYFTDAYFGGVRWVMINSLSSAGLPYGSCSLGQPMALSVR